jgi:putative transcriptional regulator
MIFRLLVLIVRRYQKMAVCYKKLWKLLIDKDLKKKDLCAMAGISSASVTKMGKGGTVNTVVIEKICTALNCDVGDIMEIINDTKDIKGNSRHATDIY